VDVWTSWNHVIGPFAEAGPLYLRIARALRRQIVSGEYSAGDAIPSEASLQEIFGTTRGTVRSALAVLVNEGLVEQVHGRGTFVRLAPVNYSIWNFGSFTDYARSRDEVPVSRVVEHEVTGEGADRVLRLVRARGLSTPTGTRFVHLDASEIPLQLFPGLDRFDFGTESLYRVMREEYGIHPARSELTIAAVQPDDAAREILRIDSAVPAVCQVNGVVFDAHDVVVDRTSVIYSPQQTLRIATTIDGGADTGARSPGALGEERRRSAS
jgi:GntR family transcriptional regulator